MHLPGFTPPPVPAHTEVTWLRVVSQTLGRSRFNYSLATSSVTTYEPNLLLRPLGLGALGLTRTGAAPARARIPRPFPRRPCFPSHSLAPSNLISSFQPTTPCSAPESPLCDPLCSSKFPFVSSCPWEREREACWLNSASTAEPAPPGPPARQADWRSGRRCWRGLSPQLRERAAQT